eukprot:Hpha_TRINITY_DN1218_c0_g1::TRINITY_DN1218_c0_g1_i1::g.44713::m.44713/K01404/GP63; leishmanolysin
MKAVVLAVVAVCVEGVGGHAGFSHDCIHDKLAAKRKGRPATVQVEYGTAKRRGEPQAKQGMRIKFFWGTTCITASNAAAMPCYCSSASQQVPNFEGAAFDCNTAYVVDAAKKTYLEGVMTDAIAYISSALKVEPVSGSLKASPKIVNGFTDTSQAPYCGKSSWNDQDVMVPMEHLTTGVGDADFLVYLSAVPTSGSTVAWALGCFQDQNGRPTAAHVNLGPDKFSTSVQKGTTAYANYVATAVHEMYHALGFSSGYWGGQDSNPGWFAAHCQATQTSGAACKPTATSTERGHSVTKLVTPEVIAKVREYSACSTLNGGELEDQGGAGTALSHWEKRVFGNEAMTGISSEGIEAEWSAITLAYFKDTGHYDVDYTKASPDFSWGKSKGCNFWTNKCSALTQSEREPEWCFPTDPTARVGEQCNYHLTGLGFCNIASQSSAGAGACMDSWFRYYPGVDGCYGGWGSSLQDYCPKVQSYSNYQCTDTADAAQFDLPLGQSRGANSRCFNSNIAVSTYSSTLNPTPMQRCFLVECAADCKSYSVKVLRSAGVYDTITCTASLTPVYPAGWTTNWKELNDGSNPPSITCWSPAEMCEGRAKLGNTCTAPPPTSHPTVTPTVSPSLFPTQFPTRFPTQFPTSAPPTSFPTNTATSFPTNFPTRFPTLSTITSFPTNFPTLPTAVPDSPTRFPTLPTPTSFPVQQITPTSFPVQQITPTSFPTSFGAVAFQPTGSPTGKPLTAPQVQATLSTLVNTVIAGRGVQAVAASTVGNGNVNVVTTLSGNVADFNQATQATVIAAIAASLSISVARIVNPVVNQASVLLSFDILNNPTPAPPLILTPRGGDDGMETWLIIVIVVASVVVLAAVVIIAYCYCCKSKDKSPKQISQAQDKGTYPPPSPPPPMNPVLSLPRLTTEPIAPGFHPPFPSPPVGERVIPSLQHPHRGRSPASYPSYPSYYPPSAFPQEGITIL